MAVVASSAGAAVSRVRMPTDGSSASGCRTRTLSHSGSEGGLTLASTLLMDRTSARSPSASLETGEVKIVVDHLEALQASQRTLQQPNADFDGFLAMVLAGHPEWRQRMAVMTKSAHVRKKILTAQAPGGRGAGSAVLGTSHPWRQEKLADDFTDHNWPSAVANDKGLHHLPGGNSKHDNVMRCPIDKVRMHPLLAHSECYSFPKDRRGGGGGHTHEDGTINKFEAQKKGNPGPGAYFKSAPRGTHFSVDGGETVIMGANHVCPWKKSLGRQINPVDVDGTHLPSAPAFSFAKTRRTVSDTAVGHGVQDGGPVKSDQGCLSPGPVYEHFGSMRPLISASLAEKRIRRSGSTGSLRRVRMIPMPPEEPLPIDPPPSAG